MTAAIIDETLGGVNYILKRYGVINHGPSFTVHLEVRTAAESGDHDVLKEFRASALVCASECRS